MTNEINIQLERLDQLLDEWKSEDFDNSLGYTPNSDNNNNSMKEQKNDNIKSISYLINVCL